MRAATTPPEAHLVRAVLAGSPILGPLPDAVRDAVAGALEWVYVPGGEAVIRPAELASGVFVVLLGRVHVHHDLDGDGRISDEELVGEIGPGGLLGVSDALSGQAGGDLVVAARDCELGRLPLTRLWALVEKHPALLQRLARDAVQDLRGRGRRIPRLTNVALVPGSSDAPLQAFGRALAEAMGALEPLLYVTAESFDRAVGRHASADDIEAWDHMDRAVVSWICDQERHNRFILYEADPTDTPWTRRVLRMADRVLVVARSDADPGLYETETLLFDTGEAAAERGDPGALVRRELVLLHGPQVRLPTGTAAWLARRPQLEQVHHACLERPEDLRRIARLLAGRPICLVLGGGGARSAAQVGAVAALRKAGIPIDAVGGTSAGAGIAAMVALGWDADTMHGRFRRAFVEMAPFSGYTLPWHSILSKYRAEGSARYLFRDIRIEDLPIRWFGVCCDLVRGRMVVKRTGLLWRAVLASTALPGVLPPMREGEQLLVDGGIFDNNPVGVMRADHPDGTVILLDIGQAEAALLDPRLPELPSNLQVWWQRLWPFADNPVVPTIPEILVRLMTLSRDQAATEESCDLYVRPPVDLFGTTQFVATDALVVIGHNHMLDVLESQVATDPALCARLGVEPDQLLGIARLRRRTDPVAPAG